MRPRKTPQPKRGLKRFAVQVAAPKDTVTLARPSWDMGAMGPANRIGLVVETVSERTPDGETANPNNVVRVRRVNRIDEMKALTMRQLQAAKAIEKAYCRVESMSSGDELKERVQSSSKPDQAVAAQVDATSDLVYAMRAVPAKSRGIIEHVCWHNHPIDSFKPKAKRAQHTANFRAALDLVADKLRY